MVLKATFILNITPQSLYHIKGGLKAHKLKLEQPRGNNPTQLFCYAKVDSRDEAEEKLEAISRVDGVNNGTYITKPEPEKLFLPVFLSSLITFATIMYAFYSAHLMNIATITDNSLIHALIPSGINGAVQFILRKWPSAHVI